LVRSMSNIAHAIVRTVAPDSAAKIPPRNGTRQVVGLKALINLSCLLIVYFW
jgi:hypothetical protein